MTRRRFSFAIQLVVKLYHGVSPVLEQFVGHLPPFAVPDLVLGQQDLQRAYSLVVLHRLAGLFREKETQHGQGNAHSQKYVVMEFHGSFGWICNPFGIA